MANPYSDMRAITARLGQVQPRGTTPVGGLNPALPTKSKEAIQLGRAANKYSIQNPELRAQIEAIANGSKGSQPQGFWGSVLGNPVTKVTLKGLEAFAVPGRAVVSGARELADVFDNNANTKASFGDFAKQVKDSQFGFGKAFKINTGSKWVDRAIGFVGDVALDPLTYVTFGASTGITKAAGYAGRVKLGQVILKDTGDKVLAAAVARGGRSALRNVPNGGEILQRVGANKFGVYFFGKRIFKERGGLRVPLSGTIGEIGEATLAKTRMAITDTRLGKYLQKMSMPKDFLDMRLKLARNQLNPEDAADALKLFDIVPAQRAARATAQQALEQELMAILRSQEADLPSYRSSVYRLLEDPAKLVDATDAEKRAYDLWRSYLDNKWDDVSARWLDADEAAEIGKTKNYFPRVASDDAKRWVNSSNPNAESVREIYLDDPFASPNAFTPRALREGKKWFNVVLKKEDLNVDTLNRIAREEGGLDFDFFETDIAEAMRRYVTDTAEEIGIIERNKALRDTGFFRRIEEQRVRELEIDEDAVAYARTMLDEQTNVLEGVEQGFRKSITDLIDGVRAEADRVKNGLATSQRLADDMSKYLYDMLDDVARQADALAQAKNRLASLWGPSRDIPMYSLTDDFPVTLRPVLAEYDQMVEDIQQMSTVLQELQLQATKEGYDVLDAEDALRRIEEAAGEAQRKMKDSMDSIESTMVISNELERVWDSIVDGKSPRVSSSAHDIIDELRNVLGVKASSTAKKQEAAVAKAVGVSGKLRSFLRNNLPAGASAEDVAAAKFFDQIFNEANEAGLGGVARTRVSDMNEQQFFDIVLNTGSKDVNLVDLRAAAMHAIGRDIRIHQATKLEDLPKATQEVYKRLLNSLKEADLDEASRIATSNASRQAKDAEQALRTRLGIEYDDAITLRNTIEEYTDVVRFIDEGIAKQFGDGWRDLEFTEDIVIALENGASTFKETFENVPWIYEYLDNPTIMFPAGPGKVNVGGGLTLGDVYNDIASRAVKMRNEFDNGSVRISDSSSENLLQGKEAGGKISKTRQQIIAEYENEMQSILKQKATDSATYKYKRWQYNRAKKASAVRDDLAENLVRYQAVSDATAKFEAVAGILGRHGLIPSEDMWRGIMRTVSKQYGSQFDHKITRLHIANQKFTDFYAAWTKTLSEMKKLPNEEQIGVGVLFKQELDKALSGEDGEILRELIGTNMANLVDVADMRVDVKTLEAAVRSADTPAAKAVAKQRLDDYFDRYVIPWAKQKDPTIRANKGPARDVLVDTYRGTTTTSNRVSKAASRAARGPLSRESSEAEVYRWINSMFDTIDSTTGDVTSKGFISQQISDAQGHYIFFKKMSDGYLDVDEFFRSLDGSANTPSSYAVQLLEWAKVIEGPSVISTRQDDIGREIVEELGPTAAGAYKKSAKVVSKAQEDAANLADAAVRAREVADAFSNPNLTNEQLKALGFTKEMVVSREAVLEHRRLMATVGYANALKDQDIVNFLDMVSGVNFSQFTDGVIIGTNRVPRYAEGAIVNTPEMVAQQVEVLQRQLAQVDIDERASLKALMAPFVVERNGKIQFKSPEMRKAYGMRKEAWDRTKKREFDFKRGDVQRKIEEAQASVSAPSAAANTEVAYDVVPVFATMPDGSVLKFTKAEWDSLYSVPLPGLEVVALNKQRAGMVAEINRLRKAYEDARSVPGKTWSPGKKKIFREIEDRIVVLQNEIKDTDYKLLVSFKETRNAALEKVRILVQGNAGDGSDAVNLSDWENISTQLNAKANRFRREYVIQKDSGLETIKEDALATDLTYKTAQTVREADPNALKPRDENGQLVMRERSVNVDKSVNNTLAYYFTSARKVNPDIVDVPLEWSTVRGGVDARKAALTQAWEKNPSYAVLQKANELAKDAAMAAYRDKESVAKNLRKAAERASTVAARTTTVTDEVQLSFRKAVMEMRNSELQAAKAAGAEFDTATPFWSTNKEVNYTLNGRTYTVPSVQDMLADPLRYVRKSKKRGDLFFDIRKPGGATIWSDASEEVRASIALFGLQSVLLNDTAKMFDAAVLNPSFARVNETYRVMAQWSDDLKNLGEKVKSVRQALEVERQSAMSDYLDELSESGLYAETQQVRKKVVIDGVEQFVYETKVAKKLDVFEFAAELRATLDNFDPSVELSPAGIAHMETTASALKKRSVLLEQLMQNMPSKGDVAALNSAKKPATREKWMRNIMDIINSNRELLGKLATVELSDGGEAVIWNALLNASAAETRFALQQQAVRAAKSNLDNATAGVYVDKVINPIRDAFTDAIENITGRASTIKAGTDAFRNAVEPGLTAQGRKLAEGFNMPSYSVSKELSDIMANTNRITDAATVRELSKFLGNYTGFFKAYATLSPGFHVRNSISNTFQLFAAGADVKNMSKGLKMWRSLGEHFKNGGTVDSWLLTIPEEDRVLAKIAAEVTLGLGGGKTDDAFAEFVDLRKNVLTDNMATRTSRKFGQRVEGSARFMLAYDSAVKGGDFTESFNRTRRFLVDYNDPTILDETVRNIIPFWTWLSRNLPLQIVTQWTNPKPYVIYQRFANNFRVEDDEQLPEYMKSGDPIKVGNSTYLSLDLPFMSTERFIEDTKNPRKMLSMVNPGLRVPVELAGGRQFFTGREFDENNSATKYAATNLLPMLGQLERITRSGDTSDELGFARYLGVPVRGVTEQQRNNELMRRLYEMQNFVNKERGQ